MSIPAIPSIGYVFSSELRERLVWFCRLRWIAVSVLAGSALLGWLLGRGEQWPAIAAIAALVAAYNGAYGLRLRRIGEDAGSYESLRDCAIYQMVADLVALLLTVHFTGGWQSPVLFLVAFHMAIGTIMLRTRTMYLLASLTCGSSLVLFAVERSGALPAVPLPEGILHTGSWLPQALTLSVLAYGIIYLTHTVTSRFMERSIELYQATTALHERTGELETLLEEKAVLQQQKSHYLRISAHQLRSPLATIKTSLQVINDGYVDASTAEGRALVKGVIARADSLIQIVNDLLEMAKMREGRAKAPWTRNVNVSQILADVVDMMTVLAEDNGVDLVPTFTARPSVILDWGVPPDLVSAFENLVHNAIKYSKADGGRVSIDHELFADRAVLVVEDDGIGIPSDLLHDVFLEFTRAPNARRRSSEGNGLGLPIVREACLLHGGTIRVESTLDLGSKFIVELPLHGRPPAEAAAARVTRQ